MAPAIPALLFVLLIGILIADVVEFSFSKLGIPGWVTLLIFLATLIGSTINIPIWRRGGFVSPGDNFNHFHRFFGYHPPVAAYQTIAINVGGAVIPILLSLWLLPHTHVLRTIIATAVVAVVVHLSATIVPGSGVEMPIWIAPLVAALSALLLTWGDRAAPMAYIAGSIGALLGADISNLGHLAALGPGTLSIGGAGVFDGVFLSGFVAALISFDRPRKPRLPRSSAPIG
jgi:uncharacterized membrane protein